MASVAWERWAVKVDGDKNVNRIVCLQQVVKGTDWRERGNLTSYQSSELLLLLQIFHLVLRVR